MQEKIIDFSQYTSIKIGTPHLVSILETPQDYYTLSRETSSLKILGKANNLLISPKAKNLVMLGKNFDYIKDCGDCLEVGAMTPSGKIFSYAKSHNLGGFEFLSGLPGSLGGIIKMNAGLKEYEIKNSLLGILCVRDSARLDFVPTQDLGLAYRSSQISTLIFAGILKKQADFNPNLVELFKTMRNNQPKEPSFGSCFKNPKGNYAGALIEKVGLKGKRFGRNQSLCFSPIHANFLVNLGNSDFFEALELINLAQNKVQEECGILLQKEVQILE